MALRYFEICGKEGQLLDNLPLFQRHLVGDRSFRGWGPGRVACLLRSSSSSHCHLDDGASPGISTLWQLGAQQDSITLEPQFQLFWLSVLLILFPTGHLPGKEPHSRRTGGSKIHIIWDRFIHFPNVYLLATRQATRSLTYMQSTSC